LTQQVLVEVAVVALCLAAGGVLKGATGAGAPILAVPAIAAFFDVRFAVVVMLIPNITTNIWQAFRFREHLPDRSFMVPLVVGGMLGIVIGTTALKILQSSTLSLVMALAVLGYVALRLARPHWRLEMDVAKWLALPAGVVAGVLQGAAGLSAPVSITFLNAIQMGRERFIAGISAFFAIFTATQIIAVAANGLIMPGDLWYSLFALLPVSLAMPAGAWLGRRVSAAALDRIILAILSVLAAKLLAEAMW
jgi:uncharacterized membrane protein YfcA